MGFLDEKIIEAKKQEMKNEHSSLSSGFFIKEEMYEFEPVEIFPGKVCVMLPKKFVDLPPNMAKFKYPSEKRPQIIKTSLDTAVNLCFNFFDIPTTSEQVKSAAEQFKMMIQKTNPAIEFFEIENEILNDSTLSWFSYRSYGIDEQIYNIMFVTSVDQKMLQGVFSCVNKDSPEWKDAFLQMLRSITDVSH